MGWGTFIAGSVLGSIRRSGRLSEWERYKLERRHRRMLENDKKLRNEFIKYVLEESVLGHINIRQAVSITSWNQLLVKASNYLFNLVASMCYAMICGLIVLVLALVYDLGSITDTGVWFLIVIWSFLVFSFLYIGLVNFSIKRFYSFWVNQTFRKQGWDVKTLLREMRTEKFPEHADLEGKRFRVQRITFRDFKKIPETLAIEARVKKERKKDRNLFPENHKGI